MCYIWDNYLQLYEAESIFLMGVGNAYLGVKVLLINRGESPDPTLKHPNIIILTHLFRRQISDLRRD